MNSSTVRGWCAVAGTWMAHVRGMNQHLDEKIKTSGCREQQGVVIIFEARKQRIYTSDESQDTDKTNRGNTMGINIDEYHGRRPNHDCYTVSAMHGRRS